LAETRKPSAVSHKLAVANPNVVQSAVFISSSGKLDDAIDVDDNNDSNNKGEDED
jgi:hypothetical protein